jgi:hypothetical protein
MFVGAGPASAQESGVAPQRGTTIVQAVDAAAGVVTLNGTNFRVTRETELVDERGIPLRLADLRALTRTPGVPPDPKSYDRVSYEASPTHTNVLVSLRKLGRMPR